MKQSIYAFNMKDKMIFFYFIYAEETDTLKWYIIEDAIKENFNWIFIIIYRFPYFLPKIMASRLYLRVNTNWFSFWRPCSLLMSHRIIKEFCPSFHPCGVYLTHLQHQAGTWFLITYLKCTTVCYHFVNLISQIFTCKYQMPL